MKTTTKKSTKLKSDKASILSAYTNYVLEYESVPTSVFKFCKLVKISEENFYNYFGSLDAVKKHVWNAFHENAIQVLHNDKAYSSYNNREKMLSYYYTIFEVLQLNRSYVLFALNEQTNHNTLKKLEQLRELRKSVKEFSAELIDKDNELHKFSVHNSIVFSEGAWVQFLLILKYWIADESFGFEKTDIIIEKSVNTVFDVIETTNLESVIDLGKFLWKEHVA